VPVGYPTGAVSRLGIRGASPAVSFSTSGLTAPPPALFALVFGLVLDIRGESARGSRTELS